MGPQPEKMISREVAEQDVIALAERLASLYQHFAQVLLAELGEEQTREIIEKVIKNYGEESGRNAGEAVRKMGLELSADNFSKGSDLPSMGWKAEKKQYSDGRENTKITFCPLARYWIDRDFTELGRLYCYVDQAKYSAFNPELKCIHVKNVLEGDAFCELAVEKREEGCPGEKTK